MALGGKMDVMLSHVVTTAKALQKLRQELAAATRDDKHTGDRALMEAVLNLDEVVKTTASRQEIRTALGGALMAASNLLEMKDVPASLNPSIADLYEAAALVLREMGQDEAADQVAAVAEKIRA